MGNLKAQVSCPPGQSLLNLYTGYGKSYTVNNTSYVGNGEKSIGKPDGIFASVKHNAVPANRGVITIDLGEIIPNLDTIYYVASSKDNNLTTWDISVSLDGVTFAPVTSDSLALDDLTAFSKIINNAGGARYIRIASTNADKDMRLDAVYYNKKTCKDYCLGSAITYSSGYAVDYLAKSTSKDPNRAIGTPNLNFSKLENNTTDALFLDLGTVLPYGTTVQLYLAADASSTVANFSVTSSADDLAYSNTQTYASRSVQPVFTDFYYNVTQPEGIRYLRIVTTTAVKGDVDAVSYKYPAYWGSNYITGFLFSDANSNMIKDVAETGAGGITVNLSKDLNNDGTYDAGDEVLQTTNTTAGGAYQFQISSVDTNYLISILPATLPSGNSLTTPNLISLSYSTLNNTDCGNNFGYYVCTGNCPPVATDDYDVSYLGTSNYINVLFNDYDPNNNINSTSTQVIIQPKKGSVVISSGVLIYTPIATGLDTITYRIADLTAPTPLWDTAKVVINIFPISASPCASAKLSHTFYVPAPEQDIYRAFTRADCKTAEVITDTFRTFLSIKCPYAGTILYYDHWEDGYEASLLNPTQSTTEVWGDRDPYNGIAPGYPNDIIPSGASIITDNRFFVNPRNPAQIYYDGKDKIYSTTDIALSRISWEANSRKEKQAYSTDVYDVNKFGTSFNIPVGNYTGANNDFQYTSLFIRAAFNNTTVSVDKDNNGIVDTTVTLQEGGTYYQDGGVRAGASVNSTLPIGIDVFFGDSLYCFNAKELNVLPAQFYGNIYYTPVPTTTTTDTAVVMFYNPLSTGITINWTTSGTSGSFNLGGKGVFRFPLGALGYKFESAGGENYVANELVDSWRFNVVPPYSGNPNNNGGDFDWAFALIPENRMTEFGSIAWAPGSSDLSANGNPVWVMPTAATTIYVKWDGNITSSTGSTSPCGFKYDVSYSLGALAVRQLLDAADKDQSGLAVYSCNGAKLAMAYGENPEISVLGLPYIDAGTAIQPFCKSKFIMANDDFAVTLTNTPVTIQVLSNDTGFTAIIDRSSVSTSDVLQPAHGTVSVNADGTLLYTPNTGYTGLDTLEYFVCSTPSVVCDKATVIIKISNCPAQLTKNIISGQVFTDVNKDGLDNDGGAGHSPAKVYLYTDGNCNTTIDANELTDSVSVDASGYYQFSTYPLKIVSDDFDGPGGTRTCNNGSDGNTAWATNWVDSFDVASVGFCVAPPATVANTDVEIRKDGAFSYGIRLKDNNVAARRSVNLSGATSAYLSFSYRRKSATLTAGENVLVQASANGTAYTTVFTITGNGVADAAYVDVYNLNIAPFASASTMIRFITNNSVDDADTVYIDNVSIKFLKYNQCYITRLDTLSSVPANHYVTTAKQYAFTATGASTCLGGYNFGITKRSITISGTVFNDMNGLSDGLINGTAIDNPSGQAIYVYLIGPDGKVAFKDTLNSSNGTYSFPLANVQTNYTLLITTTNVAVGANQPPVVLPPSWGAVGEAYGSNNSEGSGFEALDETNAYIAISTGLLNVTGVNFGIQRPSAGTDRAACYNYGGGSVSFLALTTPGTWVERYDNPGKVIISDPTSPTATFSDFEEDGEYNFIWLNGEVTDTAKVIVSRPFAGIDLSICGVHSGVLEGNYDQGTWTAMAGNPAGATLGGTVNGVADIDFTPAADGNFFYIYTINSCPDTVKLSKAPKPVAGNASSELYDCTYQQSYFGELIAPGASPNTGAWSIYSGPGSITTPTDSVTGIGSLSQTGDSTVAIWVVTNAKGCRDTAYTIIKPIIYDTAMVSKYGNEYCLTCPVQNSGMFSYYDLNGKLLARVTDSADAVSIGNTTFCGQLPYNVAGDPQVSDVGSVETWLTGVGELPQPFLPRAWNINTTTDAPMEIKLYFTDQEVAALQGATLSNGSYFYFETAPELLLIAYPNNSDTFIPAGSPNGVVYHPTFTRVDGYWQAAFRTGQAGTFYLYPSYYENTGLPVELISLQATGLEKEIRIDWATASEKNNLRFEIERSADAINFKKIGEIAGAGNYKGFHNYYYIDEYVEFGKRYYYRLKQVDFDGAFTRTKIVSAMINAEIKVKLSEFMPNPSRGHSTIRFNSVEDMDINVKIFTVEGNMVQQSVYSVNKGDSELRFDLSSLVKGLYLVQFNYLDNIETRKLIKIE
ncbi:MAG: T9SS type A sorting domain-containing protein [Sphingobacteriales bacterium]|nr:T9SS type A sorting domain-containing protein [Sphingobacteriales bacterium]